MPKYISLVGAHNPTTDAFLGLTETPSAAAARAWLNAKLGLFPEFLGTGLTLNTANASIPGLPEEIMTNKVLDQNDVILTLNCTGEGFNGIAHQFYTAQAQLC